MGEAEPQHRTPQASLCPSGTFFGHKPTFSHAQLLGEAHTSGKATQRPYILVRKLLHVDNNRERGLSQYRFILFCLTFLTQAGGFELTQKSKVSYQEENFGLRECRVTTRYLRAIRLNELGKDDGFSSLGEPDSTLPLTVLTVDRMEKNPPLL